MAWTLFIVGYFLLSKSSTTDQELLASKGEVRKKLAHDTDAGNASQNDGPSTPITSHLSTHLPSPTNSPNSSKRAIAADTGLMTPTKRATVPTKNRMEFKTPSPPKGLPDLPGPPSSDDDDQLQPSSRDTYRSSLFQTPKPPGGWFSTPKMDTNQPLAKADSLPTEIYGSSNSISRSSGLATPVGSLSRASSLPHQTPAPPGAWVNTPGTVGRRSNIMKVRFDVESEHSAVEIAKLKAGEDIAGRSVVEADASSVVRGVTMPNVGSRKPITPQLSPSSSSWKSPNFRLVDEYGDLKSDKAVEPTKGKTPVRVVDSFGQPLTVDDGLHVDKVKEEDPLEFHLGHNEALQRIRQTVFDLASGLSDIEKSVHSLWSFISD